MTAHESTRPIHALHGRLSQASARDRSIASLTRARHAVGVSGRESGAGIARGRGASVCWGFARVWRVRGGGDAYVRRLAAAACPA
eukprot:3934791-Rhodomonas_salina.2